MFGWLPCRKDDHRDWRVVGLGVEIRGSDLNNMKPYVRFYIECVRCGATGDRLREAGKHWVRPRDLLDPVIWDNDARRRAGQEREGAGRDGE